MKKKPLLSKCAFHGKERGEKRASGWEWEFNEEEVKKTTHSHELFKTNQSNRWNN